MRDYEAELAAREKELGPNHVEVCAMQQGFLAVHSCCCVTCQLCYACAACSTVAKHNLM